MTDAAEPRSLEDIVDVLDEEALGERVSFGHVLDRFAERGYGALVTVVGLVAAMPVIGAIPGVSILTGTLIILVSAQFLVGRRRLWMPARLRRVSVRTGTMARGLDWSRRVARLVDRVVVARMQWLIRGRVAERVAAMTLIFLALTFYPLAFVPWGVSAPAFAVIFLGLAIVGRDGLLAAIGYGLLAVTVWVGWRTIPEVWQTMRPALL